MRCVITNQSKQRSELKKNNIDTTKRRIKYAFNQSILFAAGHKSSNNQSIRYIGLLLLLFDGLWIYTRYKRSTYRTESHVDKNNGLERANMMRLADSFPTIQ